MESVEVFGLKVHDLDYSQALKRVREFILAGEPRWAVSINPEKAVKARRDKSLQQVLTKGDICLPDGMGVVLAARLLHKRNLKRITGIDLMKELVKAAPREGHSIFLLGSKPGVAEEAARRWKDRHPGLKIAGTHHGYFSSPREEEEVIEKIREASPHILFVALGSPRQEYWITSHLEELGVPFVMGVGGSLDVEAGVTVRAPSWCQKLGLEWLYRLLREPTRVKRFSFLPLFALLLGVEWLRNLK